MSRLAADILATPVQRLLDRGVAQSATAAALCRRLEGKSCAVLTGNSQLDAYLVVRDGRLIFSQEAIENADAVISGRPLGLLRLATGDPEEVVRAGQVTLGGDAEVAQDFQTLLEFVRPDPEEELSRLTGDTVAHETTRALRGLAAWAGRARHTLGRSLAEYLTEESRDLAAPAEIAAFCNDVDNLAAATDRLEAKMQLLRHSLHEGGRD